MNSGRNVCIATFLVMLFSFTLPVQTNQDFYQPPVADASQKVESRDVKCLGKLIGEFYISHE